MAETHRGSALEGLAQVCGGGSAHRDQHCPGGDRQSPEAHRQLGIGPLPENPAQTFPISQPRDERASGECPHHFTVELSGTVAAESARWGAFSRLHRCAQAFALCPDRIIGYRGNDFRDLPGGTSSCCSGE